MYVCNANMYKGLDGLFGTRKSLYVRVCVFADPAAMVTIYPRY